MAISTIGTNAIANGAVTATDLAPGAAASNLASASSTTYNVQ